MMYYKLCGVARNTDMRTIRTLHLLAHSGSEEVDIVYLGRSIALVALKHSRGCVCVLCTDLGKGQGEKEEGKGGREGGREGEKGVGVGGDGVRRRERGEIKDK